MPRKAKSLTDTTIKCAKRHDKPYSLFDGGGLYLLVMPTGGKNWRLKYRFAGKEHLLSMGSYPATTLSDARQRRAAAKKQIANDIDPAAERKAAKQAILKAADTFHVVTTQWFDGRKKTWNENHSKRIWSSLERDVFPYIGGRPIADITPDEILSILERIKTRGSLDTAHRVRNHCSMIFRYAVANQKATNDPAAALIGALEPAKGGHFAAITDPVKVGELLRAITGYSGSFTVQCALKLAPLLFVRPGELRKMEWEEIDFENAQWSIPAEKMKMKTPHIVPLATQALAMLEAIKPLTGASKYVFPSGRSFSRPMSDNAILAALRRMGYEKTEMCGHGWRAVFRTLADEVLHEKIDLIEHQLAHEVKDPLGRAYNRTQFLPERKRMMQTWADYLDGLREGAKVLPFRTKEA
jgi:integrase